MSNHKDLDGDTTAKRLRALSRIRKLLRLAEDQEGTPEGTAARTRAEALMESYGLHASTLDMSGGTDYRQRAFALGANSAWRRTLVHAIADHLDCVALYEKNADTAQTYGPEHALPQIEYIFTVYLRQLQRAWRLHTQDLKEEAVWDKLSRYQQLDARESFCVSFTLGVKERLELQRQQEKKDDPAGHSSSTKHRKDLDRWMRKGGVRWRANPGSTWTFSDEGYRAGLEAEVHQGLKSRSGPKQVSTSKE